MDITKGLKYINLYENLYEAQGVYIEFEIHSPPPFLIYIFSPKLNLLY